MGGARGVQSFYPIGSKIMPPGIAFGRKKLERCVVEEVEKKKEVHSVSNQDAKLDVAKSPRGGQEHSETVT